MVEPSEKPTDKIPQYPVSSEDLTMILPSFRESDHYEVGRTWFPGKEIEGLYRVEDTIGLGGMGIVYKATDLTTNKLVVIKSLLPQIAQEVEFKRRFIREAEEWIRLGAHPNIVRAYTVLDIEYLPRIVAEFIDGPALSDLLKEGLPVERAFAIATQICWGMAYAHDKSLAHRDLKPANILTSNDGTAKVTDFGLVKVVEEDSGITRLINLKEHADRAAGTLMTDGILGTPEYISPEQWDGKGGKTSDIYSFGVILYEMFCGRRPFDYPELKGLDRVTAYHKSHTQNPPPRPEDIAGIDASVEKLSPRLSALMLQCMEKSPAARPDDFRNIASELNNIAGEMAGATPVAEPSPLEMDRCDKLDQANAYLRLSKSCVINGDIDKAVKLLPKAKKIFEEYGDDTALAYCHQGIGATYRIRGKYTQAMEEFNKSMRIFEATQDVRGIIICNNQMSYIHQVLGEFDKGAACVRTSVELAEKIGNLRLRIDSMLNFASTFFWKKDYDSARDIFNKTLTLAEESNDLLDILRCHGNLGRVAQYTDNLPAALEHFDKCWQIAEVLGHRNFLHATQYNMGLVYHKLQQIDKAFEMYTLSLAIAEELDYARGMSDCCCGLATLHYERGEFKEALEMSYRDMEISESLGERERICAVWQNIGLNLNKLGRPAEALEALEKAVGMGKEFEYVDLTEATKLLEKLRPPPAANKDQSPD
ncbi:tetratricopeptide repeat protein [Planctomycetota bacterium]